MYLSHLSVFEVSTG